MIEETPVTLLVFAGTFNGLILPIGFGVLLWIAWRRRDLLQGYRYPRWLAAIGTLAWLLTLYIGYQAILDLGSLWQARPAPPAAASLGWMKLIREFDVPAARLVVQQAYAALAQHRRNGSTSVTR